MSGCYESQPNHALAVRPAIGDLGLRDAVRSRRVAFNALFAR